MTSEIDSLQERVDAIRATGDAELAGRAWHALSAVLFTIAYAALIYGASTNAGISMLVETFF